MEGYAQHPVRPSSGLVPQHTGVTRFQCADDAEGAAGAPGGRERGGGMPRARAACQVQSLPSLGTFSGVLGLRTAIEVVQRGSSC